MILISITIIYEQYPFTDVIYHCSTNYIYIRILSEDILTDGRYYITRVTSVFMESEKQSIVNNELNLICLKGICQGSVIKTAERNKRCIVYLRQKA